MIIAIDGNHKVGKSTIINNLKKYYADSKNVIFIKYPTLGDIGDFVKSRVSIENRDVLSLLFAADLTSCYQKNIQIDSSKIYILDRYVLSLFTFQGGADRENYQFLYNVTSKIHFPDVQIVIHKKEGGADVNDDPFVVTAKNLKMDNKLTRLYIVDNILGMDSHDLTGFNKVKRIIDSAIKNK